MPFDAINDLERYEGMLVRFPQDLVISEYFNYDRFGEMVLALPLDGESRPFTGTAIDEPGFPAIERTTANSLRRITLDDGLGIQNPASVRHPNGEPFSLTNRFRGYDYIDTGAIGTDAIRVGIIYKTSTVIPVGDFAILDSTIDPRFRDALNRPVLAQTFEETSSGARFTVAVNHLKSKGSGCGAGDDDTTTGQGNCNGTRTLAAQALADWLATDPTGSGDADVLIIGDLNSYAKEDPIVALQNAGYTDLVAAFGGPSAYGYVFDGQLGYLDHALANPTLLPQVTGVAEWHINADEIPLFDYNDDTRDAGEAAFEEESDVLPLFEENEFRTSDHDPVIVELDLLHYDWTGFFHPIDNEALNEVKAGSNVPVRFSLSGNQGLEVFFTGYPRSAPIDCSSLEVAGPSVGTSSTGRNSLRYDPLTDEYVYTWKTEKSWADTCRRLVVVLDDGSIHTADFTFKK
jgi:uncharacterized protein